MGFDRNMHVKIRVVFSALTVLFCVGIWIGCAYFNTFYNAQNYFREGRMVVTHDTLRFDNDNFDKAIEKSTAVLVKYPNSRYIDDAFFIMGVSYYYNSPTV